MSGGYPSKSPEPLAPLLEQLATLRSRVATLETPTGTSLSNLVEQVQAALADIDSQVAAAIAANSYTKAQTDAKVASPGNIAPNDVNASGRVSSNGAPFQSLPSRNYLVTTNYVAAWIQSDGQIGYVPSSIKVKKDLQPMDDAEVSRQFLTLVPRWGRYVWDDETEPLKAFLIAEELQEFNVFGPDVIPVNEDGDPVTINYGQLVPILLSVLRDLNARLVVLEGGPPPEPAPEYPAWIAPTGAHDAYALGARVTHSGLNWESAIAANVWEPTSGSTLWTVLV